MSILNWKKGLLAAVAVSGLAGMAQAEDSPWGPISGGVTLTSDYRFRGVSQSSRDAAVQGWLQYDHASGFFANVWASSIDFNDADTYDSSAEVDLTAGYNFKIMGDTDATAKVLYYWYPGADASGLPEYNYWELAADVSHKIGKVTVTGDFAYSPDFFLETGDSFALTGGASIPVMDTFLFFTGGLEASAHVGHQWIDDNANYGSPDYTYYDFGATATWEQFSFDVRWIDTDLNHSECLDTSNCQGGIVLSLSADLPG